MGIKFVNRSSIHLHTRTRRVTHTRTLHLHTMHQHLFLSCEYKTTLTGALSALVELSRWNVYLYIQMAWCHVVSHNVSWTNNVSHFSIRPAALKPPSSLYSRSNTQAPWLQKREPCVATVKCHSELNPRDIEVSSISTVALSVSRKAKANTWAPGESFYPSISIGFSVLVYRNVT